MASTIGKTITCRAAILWSPDKPLTVETIEVEPPKRNEVRVKIVASGICRTDSYPLIGKDVGIDMHYPTILGHEGGGIVESVGEDVTEFSIGDYVVPTNMSNCKQCDLCKNPLTNLCVRANFESSHLMSDGTSRFKCKGRTIYRNMGIATFTEYTVQDKYGLSKINPKADLIQACIIGCCIPTGYGSAVNLADVNAGSTVAIWGLGGIGFAVAMGCKERKVKRMIGIDINEDKQELAMKFGFTEFINAQKLNEPIDMHLKKLTHNRLDYAFECSGNIIALKDAYASLSAWGRLLVVGGISIKEELTIKPSDLLFGKRIISGVLGGFKMIDGVKYIVDKCVNNELDVGQFVTSKIKLEEVNEGLELLNSGKTIRTVIVM